ncbi:esterase/lipase family protein [Streptomyces telluris]|uniref:Alpha/beta fold hydrolase n=1 Tax=Streptomyces telluris TaxID=2720021 RepID=A0A9X2RN31_9ACTN|nr:alpha/beta fold hydrolase [Streptomyces telluris]MCQ8772557.1 alpha/beta fold hydrolase [Streptomyces telluris]NJP76339.1 alpha/beta fold hydrolase [Streptomyces telluris]
MKLSWRPLRTLLPALALALSAAALTAPEAVAAPSPEPRAAAAGTAVSSGWNDYSCKPSAAHPRPVVLVHGTLGNSWDNWLVLAPYLKNRGYCVFSLDYGKLPGVPAFYGLGPIAKSAEELSAYVDKVRGATGADKVDIVGHSQGGAMPRYYLNFLGGKDKVNSLTGIAPNNHGTTMSGLVTLMDKIPGARKALGGMTPGLTDQAIGSDYLKRMNSVPDTVPGVRYTVIATKYDEVVTPYTSGYLTGPDVRNILLQDLCAVDLSEHIAIGTVDRIVAHEVANALDPEHATPTTCASVIG